MPQYPCSPHAGTIFPVCFYLSFFFIPFIYLLFPCLPSSFVYDSNYVDVALSINSLRSTIVCDILSRRLTPQSLYLCTT